MIVTGFIFLVCALDSILSATYYNKQNIHSNPLNKTLCNVYKGNKSLIDQKKMMNRKSTLLLSYPGSGNTWVRLLIEAVTGVYTGSIYTDKDLALVFPMENRCSPRLSVIKGHPESFELCSSRSSSWSGTGNNNSDSNNNEDVGNNIIAINNSKYSSRSSSTGELCIVSMNPKERKKCYRSHHHYPSTSTNSDVTRFSKFIFLVRDPMAMIFAEFQRQLHRGKHNKSISSVTINEKLLLRFVDTILTIAKQMKVDWEKSLLPIIQYYNLIYSNNISSNSNHHDYNHDFNSNSNILFLKYENLINKQLRYRELSQVLPFLQLDRNNNDNNRQHQQYHQHYERIRCAFEVSDDKRIHRNKTAQSLTLSILMKKLRDYDKNNKSDRISNSIISNIPSNNVNNISSNNVNNINNNNNNNNYIDTNSHSTPFTSYLSFACQVWDNVKEYSHYFGYIDFCHNVIYD